MRPFSFPETQSMAASSTPPNTVKPTGHGRSTVIGDVPEDLRRRYYLDGRGGLGLGFYADATIPTPAFRDRGDRLVATRTDPHTIRHLTAIARHRGWTQVTLSGEPSFRREAWLIARAEGLEVKGYRPTTRDTQDLERRIEARRRREAWTALGKDLAAARAPDDRGLHRERAKSRLDVAEAVVRARVSDPAAQARLVEAARSRLAGWLERGARLDPFKVEDRQRARRERIR
jgi:hypothetical protein